MPTVEDISALPKLTLNRPPRSCRDELLRPELCAAVPRMAVLIDDVDFKAQQLAYEDVPIVLPPDELFALVAYTYDTQSGKDEPDGELYYELNTALRKRKPDERKLALATWGGFLYYLLSALSKLADVQTVVYRGYPDKATVLDKYKVGRSAACNSETVRYAMLQNDARRFNTTGGAADPVGRVFEHQPRRGRHQAVHEQG